MSASVSAMVFMFLPSKADFGGARDTYGVQSLGLEG